jgi:hypothetical protein
MRTLAGGKQPAETFLVGVDFSPVLATGESLALVGSTCTARVYGTSTDATDTLIETGSLEVSGTVLQARLVDGEDGVYYLVEFRAATSDGNLYEQDVMVGVSNG